MGKKVCHGDVIAIYRTSWGTEPYIHPALLGAERNGWEKIVREKQNQGSKNKWPRT